MSKEKKSSINEQMFKPRKLETKKEFRLSDWVIVDDCGQRRYHENYVKEFIRILNEEIESKIEHHTPYRPITDSEEMKEVRKVLIEVLEIIENRAGGKLK